MAALLNSNEKFSVTAEYSCLKNGKYRGVVVETLTGRFSADNFEIQCEKECDSKEEAIGDAKELVERRRQGREVAIDSVMARPYGRFRTRARRLISGIRVNLTTFSRSLTFSRT